MRQDQFLYFHYREESSRCFKFITVRTVRRFGGCLIRIRSIFFFIKWEAMSITWSDKNVLISVCLINSRHAVFLHHANVQLKGGSSGHIVAHRGLKPRRNSFFNERWGGLVRQKCKKKIAECSFVFIVFIYIVVVAAAVAIM